MRPRWLKGRTQGLGELLAASIAGATIAIGIAVLVAFVGPALARGVRVRPGDTLTALSERYGITLGALAAANNLTDLNRIYAGAILRLPAAAGSEAAHGGASRVARGGSGASAGAAGGARGLRIRVGFGATLSAIARRYRTTVAALVSANGITDPNYIRAGTRLLIPTAAQLSGANLPASVTARGLTASPPLVARPTTPSLPPVLLANPDRLALRPYFEQAAGTYGVPVSLLEALCWWESGWQTAVVSVTGAVGLCQVEPSTAAFVNGFLSPGNPLDVNSAAGNIEIGAEYLAYLLRRTGGDERGALAGYFQGLASVRRRGPLPQTRHYVAGILAYDAVFSAAR